jgi:hypothetical protein
LFPFTFCTLWLNQWWLPLDVYFYFKSVELNLCKSKYKKLEFLLNKYKLSAGFSLDFEIFLKSCSPVLDSVESVDYSRLESIMWLESLCVKLVSCCKLNSFRLFEVLSRVFCINFFIGRCGGDNMDE